MCLQWAAQAGGHAPHSVLRTDSDKGPPWRCGRVPLPLFVPGDPSVFAAPSAGLKVELAFAHPCLDMGTWICSSVSLGMELTEVLYEWVWQLPNEICCHGEPILCGEVPPVVLAGCFPNCNSATVASTTFFCCSWQIFKALFSNLCLPTDRSGYPYGTQGLGALLP